MTQVTSQALQKVGKRKSKKVESSDNCRKLAGTVQTRRGEIVRSRHEKQRPEKLESVCYAFPAWAFVRNFSSMRKSIDEQHCNADNCKNTAR